MAKTLRSTVVPVALLGVQVFGTPGAFVYVPTPGPRRFTFRLVGAGGGGGGCAAAAVGQVAFGGGGGAAGYVEGFITSVLASYPVTIGAKGLGGIGNNPGTAGGDSTFGLGPLATAGGGGGGPNGASAATVKVNFGSVPGTASGGDRNWGGQWSHAAIRLSGNEALSGSGGNGPLGSGGRGRTGQGNGFAAGGNGTGGGGGLSINGGAVQDGSDGTNGLLLIEEYA